VARSDTGTFPKGKVKERYVDNDRLVLAHARALLTSTPEGVCDYIDADLREPGQIVETAAETLDFAKPIAIMMLGILNFIVDTGQARTILRHLLGAVPAGSYISISRPTTRVRRRARGRRARVLELQRRGPDVLALPCGTAPAFRRN
jgi:S-adenosyl methyltransferase